MKSITDINQLDLSKTYTYADYVSWKFRDRIELIWGKIRKMTSAPSTRHQKVLGKLHVKISNVMEGHPCQIFIAPFDVRLPLEDKAGGIIENVVQPDLCIVCDDDKIDEKGCVGAPDLILEVISPSSSTRDMKDKLKLYEKAKVKEYWVVEPHDGIIHVFILKDNGKYYSKYPVTAEDIISAEGIDGLSIDLTKIFPDILKEPEEDYLQEGVKRL
jgi:Uma2 family endonuclease